MGGDGWGSRSFGELFEIQLGKMLSPKAKVGDDPKPYLRNVNVQWNRVDVDDVARMDFSAEERAKFALRRGDLLVCEGGEVGRSAIWKGELEECYYQKALHRLRPRTGDVDPTYVLHYLTQKFQVEKAFVQEHGQTTIAHLPKERLERLPVLLPPLAEQRKIAAILSSVDETIEKTEAVIAQLDVVKKAMLEELLTDGLPGLGTDHWRSGTVQSFGRVDGGRQLAPNGEGSARPYLRVANVFDGRIDSSDVKSMPLTDAEFERFRLRVGDVLLNEGQSIELVGRAALYRGDPPVCAFQNSLIRFQSGPEAVPEFMEQLFRYWQRTGAFRSVAKQTTSIAHLGVSRFASMDLRLPPRVEQQRIADAVGSLDTRSAAEARTRDALLGTKMALAGALLSGTVRVHGEGAA
jgi:type I restriction enzyme S subunit